MPIDLTVTPTPERRASSGRGREDGVPQPWVAFAVSIAVHAGALAFLIEPRLVPPESPPRVLRAELRPTAPAKAETVRKADSAPPKPSAAPPRRILSVPLEQQAASTPVVAAQPPSPPTDMPANAPVPPAPPTARVEAAAVSPPRFDAAYLNNPKPAYPALARRMGEEGKVILRVFVEADGAAGRMNVHQPSGSARLDEAAMAAVAHWKFVPARQGGENVGAWVLVPIVFRLEN